MVVRFADVVKGLRQKINDFPDVSIHVGSPVCGLYGPCFLPSPGRELAAEFRRVVGCESGPEMDQWLSLLESASAGIHLPEDMGWLSRAEQEVVELAVTVVGKWVDFLGDEDTPAEVERLTAQAVEAALRLMRRQRELLEEKVRSVGLEPTEQIMAEFIVLHELGHYFGWLDSPDQESWERQVGEALIDMFASIGSLEDLASAYRTMSHEEAADWFALECLRRLYGTVVPK